MATTNKPVSSHDKGPEARKTNTDHRKAAEPRTTQTVDQGPEEKAKVTNPNRDNAADRDDAQAEVESFLKDAAADGDKTQVLAAHKSAIPDRGVVDEGDSAANIPVSEVAAGIADAPQGNPSAHTHTSGVEPDIAFGDPDSIAAWNRRHEEEAKLRAQKDDTA